MPMRTVRAFAIGSAVPPLLTFPSMTSTMRCMSVLVWLRQTSARWDTPGTPPTQRHAFGAVLVSWLIAAVAVAFAVVRWELLPLIFLGLAIGTTVGAIRPRRQQSRRQEEPQGLRPYQPTDADDNPWEHRAPKAQ
jgi:hypothetical protein